VKLGPAFFDPESEAFVQYQQRSFQTGFAALTFLNESEGPPALRICPTADTFEVQALVPGTSGHSRGVLVLGLAGQLSPATFSLRECVREATSTVAINAQQKAWSSSRKWRRTCRTMLSEIHSRRRQVLLNLLNNAIKFTSAGSLALRSTLYDQRGQTVSAFSRCPTRASAYLVTRLT